MRQQWSPNPHHKYFVKIHLVDRPHNFLSGKEPIKAGTGSRPQQCLKTLLNNFITSIINKGKSQVISDKIHSIWLRVLKGPVSVVEAFAMMALL